MTDNKYPVTLTKGDRTVEAANAADDVKYRFDGFRPVAGVNAPEADGPEVDAPEGNDPDFEGGSDASRDVVGDFVGFGDDA